MYGLKSQTGGKAGTWVFHACAHSLAAVAVLFLYAGTPAYANEDYEDFGTWLNTDRKGKIELRECGEKSLCGELVWLKEPRDERGKLWRDQLNPDPKLRSRPVIGVNVLVNAKKIAPMTWQGQIYDPEVGKLYYLKYIKVGKNRVEIKGCLSSGWPCRTKYWTRTKPLNPRAPTQFVEKRGRPKPVPTQGRKPHVAAIAPVASPSAPAVAPPARAKVPYPPRMPQSRAPVPPAPAVRPSAPDVTASLSRPVTSQARSGYLIQVAARQSHNEALEAYNELQRRYPQLLGKLTPEVLKADLGQRGVWYRVGIGPVAQQSVADNFCQRLKAVGADCLIRRW